MPDYIGMMFKPGQLPDYTPKMGGGHPERFHDEKSLMTFLRKCVEQGILKPVETEEAWLTFEDIGPSAVWIVNHEEQPDYMGADHVLIVKIGGSE